MYCMGRRRVGGVPPRLAQAALALLAALAIAGLARAHQPYYVDDLGTLEGFNSHAYSINQGGSVVGSIIDGPSGPWAVRYIGQTPQGLGSLAGFSSSLACSINDQGLVAGKCSTLAQSRPALYRQQAWLDLGSLGGTKGQANDVSNSGIVVGTCRTGAGASQHAFMVNPLDSDGDSQPDTWYRDANHDGRNDLMQDLGALGGSYSEAKGVNSAGRAVGWATTASGTHAFVYAQGTMRDLGPMGGIASSASAISDSGVIVGRVDIAQGQSTFSRAFRFRDLNDNLQVDAGELCLLPVPVDGLYTASGVNDAGEVVGSGDWTGTKRAYLWSGSSGWDLNTLISPTTSLTLAEATGINNAGQIAASGFCQADQRSHAYLLNPARGGDATADRRVSIGDLGILAGNWGLSGRTWAQGDFTGDGVVNIADLGVLAGSWGWIGQPVGATGAPVPEPAVLALLAIAAMVRPKVRRPA